MADESPQEERLDDSQSGCAPTAPHPSFHRHHEPEGRRGKDHDRRELVSVVLAAAGVARVPIDLDPQAHATLHFGIEPRPEEPSSINS